MITNRYSAKRTVFNITNVCNFGCNDCYSFNNYNFKGHRQWAPYAQDYAQWAEIFDVGVWKITGGEIMLNPEWLDWVKGVHALWPNNKGEISTNGSLIEDNLHLMDELYHLMKNSNGTLNLVISLHDISRLDEILDFSKSFLGPTWKFDSCANFEKIFINHYNQIKGADWPSISNSNEWHLLPYNIINECRSVFGLDLESYSTRQLNEHCQSIKNDPTLLDKNFTILLENSQNVKIKIHAGHIFYKSAISYTEKSATYNLFNNDPKQANTECQKEYCAQGPIRNPGHSELAFFDGKLYKCNSSKLFQEFDHQFNLSISDSDRALINSYVPATLTMSPIDLDLWFSTVNDAMEMCKFCPSHYTYDVKVSATNFKKTIKLNLVNQQ